MRKRLRFSVSALIGLTTALPAGAISLEEFQAKLQKQVESPAVKGGLSVKVEVLGSGKTLFSHNPKLQLLPASSAKLVTTLTALEKLGPGFTYETKVYAKGGDLILQGNGDPYLVSERLWLLVRDVARAGIKRVGAIRVNNSNFSEDYRGLIDWDDSGEPFTAVVAATSLNFNSLEVHIVPVPGGKKPRVELGPVPHGYATLLNEAKMVPGSKRSITVTPVRAEANREVFRVTGTVGKDAAPGIEYASVSHPESYLAHVFAAMLREQGITVTRDFGGSSFGPLDAGASLVATQGSLPLLDQVRLLNTFSNNFMTEQVFQAIGATNGGGPASIAKSRRAALEFLRAREPCREAELDNGSGLSWKTRVSSSCFVELLQNSYRDFRIFADFIGSLPIGGQTGTLKSRFKKAGNGFEPWKVRAKTGTLWSRQAVTSLVGFTQAGSGELVAFAILQNDSKAGSEQLQGMRDWEDKCVEFIQRLRL